MLDVRVAGKALVLLPPTGVQQHAVAVVLVHRLHLLVPSLADGLLHLRGPGLDQQVERGRDEGEADVLDHLGLVWRNGDGPLLEINLQRGVSQGASVLSLYLDAVDVKSVFPVLSWQHYKHRLGARPPQINELHRKVARIAFYSGSSYIISLVIRK